MKILNVENSLSIKNINAFKDELMGSLKQDDVSIDFKQLQRADLSVLQVLFSAKSFASRNKKKIKLLNISSDLKNQMKICGIIQIN